MSRFMRSACLKGLIHFGCQSADQRERRSIAAQVDLVSRHPLQRPSPRPAPLLIPNLLHSPSRFSQHHSNGLKHNTVMKCSSSATPLPLHFHRQAANCPAIGDVEDIWVRVEPYLYLINDSHIYPLQ